MVPKEEHWRIRKVLDCASPLALSKQRSSALGRAGFCGSRLDLLIMPDILGKGRSPAQTISPIIRVAFGPFQGNLWEMAPDQDLQTGSEHTATEASAEALRPNRRSSRGRRGRGRRRRAKPTPTQQTNASEAAPEESSETAAAERDSRETEEQPQTPSSISEPEPDQLRETPPAAAPARPSRPASKASIQETIDQVNQIIDSLKESLEQMDEVLEVLEYFERQGHADEREIESLRRSLRQLQRPREGGRHPHHGHS